MLREGTPSQLYVNAGIFPIGQKKIKKNGGIIVLRIRVALANELMSLARSQQQFCACYTKNQCLVKTNAIT